MEATISAGSGIVKFDSPFKLIPHQKLITQNPSANYGSSKALQSLIATGQAFICAQDLKYSLTQVSCIYGSILHH